MNKYLKKYFCIMAMLCLIIPALAFGTAETLTGTRAGSTFPTAGIGGIAGSCKVAYGTYEAEAAVEDGDIFQLCKVPRGATVIGGFLYCDDLDVGTEALDMDVGWAANGSDAADADGLLNGGTLTGDAVTGYKPESGTLMPFGGVLITSGYKTFARETTIQVEVNTAAGSWTNGTIGVVVYYTMD